MQPCHLRAAYTSPCRSWSGGDAQFVTLSRLSDRSGGKVTFDFFWGGVNTTKNKKKTGGCHGYASNIPSVIGVGFGERQGRERWRDKKEKKVRSIIITRFPSKRLGIDLMDTRTC